MTYFNMRMSRGMPGRGRRHCGCGRGRSGKFITDIHVRERKELEEDDHSTAITLDLENGGSSNEDD